MAQVTFINPKTNATYVWPVNPPPDGPQQTQKLRQIQRASNTGNVGVTKQQGDDGSFILHWTFNVFHAAHQQALWQWYMICKSQTIYLTDWEGNEYEGQIIAVGEQWQGALAGPGDTNARMGYAKMEMQFEVYRFVSGYMATAGVTP